MNFLQPTALWFAIPIILVSIAILLWDFVKFKDSRRQLEYEEAKYKRRTDKIVMIVTRSLIVILLLIALAGPFTLKQHVIAGDQSLKILADNSTSFQLFPDLADTLKKQLEDYLPTTIQFVGLGEISAIGDGVLAALKGNDNILLVTDGNSNVGRDLGDILFYATSINTSINAVDLQPMRTDVGVSVIGPRRTVADVENTFIVHLENPSGVQVDVEVFVDGQRVIQQRTAEDLVFTRRFGRGKHQMIAQIGGTDHFIQNNAFYKVIEVVPKPNILFVGKGETPMKKILDDLYQTEYVTTIPNNLEKYHAVILSNLPHIKNDRADVLSEYVIEGNGLYVIGGDAAYNLGDYEGTLFETLLPVTSGVGSKIEGDVNAVIVLDISGSTGKKGGLGATKADVEKAQALSIISDFRASDRVGVVAFNTESFEIVRLKSLAEGQGEIISKIERLQDGGGTYIDTGLSRAIEMLRPRSGSRNIVLISDGKTKRTGLAVAAAKEAAELGMQVFTIGVGGDTHVRNMQELARLGGGIYFQADQTARLRILFGRPPTDAEGLPTDTYPLTKLDENHFITQGLEVISQISGYNQIVPKSSAQNLVGTIDGHPVMVAWRFGLGRVVAFGTDDGSKYAGELLSPKHSEILSRGINWAIGSLNRRSDTYVDLRDTHLDRPIEITVKSPTIPKQEGLDFIKVDKNLYKAEFVPTETGFVQILDNKLAVNYPSEYKQLGINRALKDAVVGTGGQLVDPNDIQSIIRVIEQSSKRLKTENIFYRWPFIIAALIIYLGEVCYRRLMENRRR